MTAGTKRPRLASRIYGWRWPVGLWRLRGRATIDIAGHSLKFVDVVGGPTEWWALEARHKRWEQPVIEAFAAAVRPGDTVYDIGAWVGAYALVASRAAGPTGRVFTFEPDPVARAQLERNIAANRATNVTVLPIALGASNGTARLTGGGSEARVGTEGDIVVQTQTLPDFIEREGPPDVVKVDIEGGEIGLDRTALSRARELFIEVHVPALEAAAIDPEAFLDEIAAGRPVTRLEGDATNFNVRIA